MVKRWRWWLMVVGVAGTALAVYALLPWMQQGVTLANVQRIVPGLTREEVETILGPPNYPADLWRKKQVFWDADAYSLGGRWYISITVHFDADGRVDRTQVTSWPR